MKSHVKITSYATLCPFLILIYSTYILISAKTLQGHSDVPQCTSIPGLLNRSVYQSHRKASTNYCLKRNLLGRLKPKFFVLPLLQTTLFTVFFS